LHCGGLFLRYAIYKPLARVVVRHEGFGRIVEEHISINDYGHMFSEGYIGD